MSGGRVTDPSWGKDRRFVSLGSGARERACQCSCNYRTRGSSIRGTCYTTLKNEPPLISCDKQPNWHALIKGDESPLVRLVRRESIKQNIRETPRLTRPLSAATCTQKDANSNIVLQKNNLMISVKGQNMSWHERPLTKRMSESCTTDHAIKSIHEATSEELTKISSFLSNSGPIVAPRPPLPSPEQSEEEEEGDSCEESLEEFVVDRVTSEASSIASSVLRGQIQADSRDETSTDGFVNFERETQSGGTKFKRSFKYTNTIRNGKTAADRTSGSRKRIDFKLPTDHDNDISESENDLLEVTNAKTIASYPVVFEDSRNHLPVANYQLEPPRVSNHRESRRPHSAFAALGARVINKTIEFVSEKELTRAKCHISQRSLQTMMYMDYLKEKGRLAREAKEDGKCVCDKDSCSKDLAKSSDVNLVKLPPEMHVSPKPPTQRKIFQSQPQGTLMTTQKETNEVRPGVEQQSPADKLNRLREKRIASARKILMKAERKMNETKEECKQEASMIWRSITKIDDSHEISRTNRKSSPEDSANGRDFLHSEAGEEKDGLAVYKTNTCSSQQDDVTTRSNGDRSVSEKESTKLTRGSSVKFDIPESNRNFSCDNLQETSNRDAVQEKQHLRKSSKTRPSSSRTRTNSLEKILRPTSAVILRHLQNKKEDSSPKRNKTRSASSIAGIRKDKIQQEQKRRPVSAAVRRASIGASRRSGDKVISSESVDLKLENKKVSFSSIPNGTTRTTNAVRRNSAKTQSSPLKSTLKKRPISAPVGTVQGANRASELDIVEEEQKISDECRKILEACERKGIKISIDTLTRALMPPSERATPYHKDNLPHSSRLLSTPPSWTRS